MTLYTVRVACHVAGQWRTPDKPFELTPEQARYLAPPYGSVVAPFAPVVAAPDKDTEDNGRQHRDERPDRRASKRLGARRAVDIEGADDAAG